MQTYCSSFALALVAAFVSDPARADEAQIARGEYLVGIAGCGDCHTPGYFLGNPDFGRFLGGSEVGFEVPGLGTFYGPNLTPDLETGLGTWSTGEIVTAITAGVRPDDRALAPVMPWRGYSKLTAEDAVAIALYLQSLPPVTNEVPGPFGLDESATSFTMRVIPPGG